MNNVTAERIQNTLPYLRFWNSLKIIRNIHALLWLNTLKRKKDMLLVWQPN